LCLYAGVQYLHTHRQLIWAIYLRNRTRSFSEPSVKSTRVGCQLSRTGHSTQSPSSGHFECYPDFAPTAPCGNQTTATRISTLKGHSSDKASEVSRARHVLHSHNSVPPQNHGFR